MMKQQSLKWITLTLTMAAILFLAACHKKQPPPPPPPPPPPAAPTASLSANPGTIQAGQSATLTWQTTNATDISIDAIGAVQASGSQSVTPNSSTTYTLTAKGAGGTQTATAQVTVTPLPPPPPPPPPPAPTDEELFSRNVKDIYFDYDKADIRADQQSALQGDIDFLKQHPNIHFEVGGYCDERGSTEYNLGLGDNRANAVKNALVQGGVGAANIQTRSYGKEKPFCSEHTEDCWQQNRRGHFVYQK